MDAPNLDITGKPPDGLHLLSPDRSDRLFLENDASRRVRPSIARRILRAFARFLFAVLVGVGGTLALQSYADQGKMEVIRAWTPWLAEVLPGSTSKPAVSPIGAAEVEQLKPIATDLAAVRHTLEQITVNQDQLTRTQQDIAQSITALQAAEQELTQKLSSPPPAKPVHVLPPPKPVQHPPQPPTQASSKPLPMPPPQPLQPPQQR
jgi:hypothetical protein